MSQDEDVARFFFLGTLVGLVLWAILSLLLFDRAMRNGVAHRACTQMGYTRGELDSNWHVICEQETVTGDVTTVTRFKLGAQK